MTARSHETVSYSGALVLQAIQQGFRHGFDILHATGLPSGSVYPLLRRLEAAGLVDSQWEDVADAHGAARPQRRYYALTPSGRTALAAARDRVRSQQALFGGRRRDTARGRG